MALLLAFIICLQFTFVVGLTASSTVSPTSSSGMISSSGGRAPTSTKECVIVGGGPVGLAAALTLSNHPHYYNVTLIEKATDASRYDPTRAYLYNVNPRGLVWFDRFPEARRELEARSTPSGGPGGTRICYIPADPKTPIVPPKEIGLPDKRDLSYWIPRNAMVGLLEDCCRKQETQRVETNDEQVGSITLKLGTEFESISAYANDRLAVKCKDGSCYDADLVIGADGMDSQVRSCLADQRKNGDSWLQSKASSFRVRKYRSPSTGLRLKSLQFEPNFQLVNSTGEKFATQAESMYVFRGVNSGTTNYMSLGFLPSKDPSLPRPGNINTRPDHDIWKLDTGAHVKEYFAKNFPRIPWDDVVPGEEWDRFAKAKGTTFPFCQYSPGSAVPSPSMQTGVALVGDACHAFPPDIGQGINAGLQDVVALDRALSGKDSRSDESLDSGEDLTVGERLLNYQRNRGPEHKALIRLARCGAPYQYRQPWMRDRIGRFLHTSNVIFRLLLNKLSGGLVPPAAIMIMAKRHELTYRQVMRRAALTSRIIKLALLSLLWWKLFRPFFLA